MNTQNTENRQNTEKKSSKEDWLLIYFLISTQQPTLLKIGCFSLNSAALAAQSVLVVQFLWLYSAVDIC